MVSRIATKVTPVNSIYTNVPIYFNSKLWYNINNVEDVRGHTGREGSTPRLHHSTSVDDGRPVMLTDRCTMMGAKQDRRMW